MQKNTIRDGISTALDAAYTVDTVYTALHCLNNSIHAYCLHILLGKVWTLWTGVDRSGYPLDCYNYESTCGAKSIIFFSFGCPNPLFQGFPDNHHDLCPRTATAYDFIKVIKHCNQCSFDYSLNQTKFNAPTIVYNHFLFQTYKSFLFFKNKAPQNILFKRTLLLLSVRLLVGWSIK